MKKYVLLLAFFLVSLPLAFAANIVMSVDQSTYYFKTGENAVIPLKLNNSYGKPITGDLQYTVTQQITQGVAQFSTSNTQSTRFTVIEGNQTAALNFGTSNSPVTYVANLSFNYNDGNEMTVALDSITIIFVSDESQKNNTQNKLESSSEKATQSQNDPFAQQQQRLQEKLDQMLQNQLSSQNSQQKLQNNQIPEDSSALRQQMQRQSEERNKLQQEFQKQLASNGKFQELHKGLLQQGYNVTNGNITPTSNSTGDFEINYKNEQGKWAKIQGSMINGTVTNIQKQTQEERDNLLAKLREDPTFKKYVTELNQEGFSEKDAEFQNEGNKTSIQLNYENDKTQSASIKAEFVDENITKIDLEKPNPDYSYLLPIPIIILSGILGFFLYKKLEAKKKIKPVAIQEKISDKPFDFVFVSGELIKEARKDFKEEKYKDAYGKISQSIRLFLSYKAELKREITNEDILLHLRSEKYPIDDIRNCFRLSSLVEFAKYTPNPEDFSKMCSLAEKIIYGHYDNTAQ
jgi:hypothetical protein